MLFSNEEEVNMLEEYFHEDELECLVFLFLFVYPGHKGNTGMAYP